MVSATTLQRPKTRTSVPPVFVRAFEEGTSGLQGYGQPYVIVERLALVAPETLHTRFYTSAHATQPGFKPVGRQRFRFPNSHSLSELVDDLHRQLRAMDVAHTVVPDNVDEKTGLAAIEHQLRDGPGSDWFENRFRPVFYGIFNAMVIHYGAVEINKR